MLLALAIALSFKESHMNSFRVGWYVIYTKPRHEKKVHAQLSEMDISSYLPLTKKLRTWHDRKKYIDEPLFPSYVFIYLKDLRNYYDGMGIDGALHYVRVGKEISRVHDTVINNIKLTVGQAETLEVTDERFAWGRRLVISRGPLCGLDCELVQAGAKQKILVRVDLLQRNLLITVAAEDLIAI